jgi:uncharacterized protein (TIGR00369 family)
MSTTDSRREQIGRAMLDRALSTNLHEFGSFFLSRFFGFEIAHDADRCIVSFEATETMFNPQGSLHGGILATAMDVSMGHLLRRIHGAGTTLEMKIQYLGSVRGGLVRCEASFLRVGRSICFLQCVARTQEEVIVAHATSTWRRLVR